MHSGRPLFTPVIHILLSVHIAMYSIEILAGIPLINALALWPLSSHTLTAAGIAAPDFHIWQLLTYSFLHGGLLHLFVNMYALWMFGTQLENVWGPKQFVIYYFFCVMGAGLTQLMVVSMNSGGEAYPTVGASGGVFGLLLAFGVRFPRMRLMLLFPPIVLQARWFVIIYGAIELWAGITGSAAGIAHFAHLGGMFFGLLLLLYWRRFPPSR